MFCCTAEVSESADPNGTYMILRRMATSEQDYDCDLRAIVGAQFIAPSAQKFS
jgi:hypothetical protein